jgi:hypothetical protein
MGEYHYAETATSQRRADKNESVSSPTSLRYVCMYVCTLVLHRTYGIAVV